jgi:4-hydroxybenzoate polyprenyltransferase/phosphoserine phosphatase
MSRAPTVALASADHVPLVVDVDGTLIKSDLLHEALLQFAGTHPLELWRLPGWLGRGKAGLKAALADRGDASADSVPLRSETLAIIRAAQAEGRPVYLASASDRRWVDRIAARVGDIAGVMATDAHVNLAGSNKADALIAAFGQGGFDYVGDNRVDMPVWAAARRQLVVAGSSGFEAGVVKRFPDAEIIARPRVPRRAYLKAMRPHQWAKNILVFLPVVAGHQISNLPILLAACLAAIAFSLAASSAYVINDLLDLPADREHPRKRLRPFAAGTIPVAHGVVQSALLMAMALALTTQLPARFLLVLCAYIVLTLAYSLVIKRHMLVDVVVLCGLYTVRVFGGLAATGLAPSQWLLMFSLFLFLDLAIVKRCSELIARREAGKTTVPGRGYRIEDLAALFPLAAGAGFGAVLIVALYLSSPEVALLYSHPKRMYLMCPLLIYWTSRILMLTNRNEMHDDPVIFALTDRVSLMTGLGAFGIILISI